MSKYENYDSVSRNYDSQRFAMGSDVIAAMIQFYCGKPLKELHVLDAGCGTGNYAKALIEYGVGNVTLLDASSGMLEKARVKLADEIKSGKVKDVVEATMPPIPFPDGTFDAVMFNLVLHHLDKGDDTDFPNAIQTLKNTKRALKPNGVIIASVCQPYLVSKSVWFSQLDDELTDRFNKRVPSLDHYQHMFDIAEVKCVSKLNILGSSIVKDYYRLDGPLDPSWRQTISYWKLATEDNLNRIEKKITELKETGQLEKWVKEHDHTESKGFLTFLICKLP